MKKLSAWAKENNVSYHTAYQWFKNGKIPMASRNAGGSIMVEEKMITANVNKQLERLPDITPVMVASSNGPSNYDIVYASSDDTSYRRNRAATITRTDRYANIENTLTPFQYGEGGAGGTNISIKDAIVLCQKAYYNFSAFRNVIDLMTEFSVGTIQLKGGTVKSRNFFNILFNKFNILNLQDRFYREYYRSGNVFVYRFDGRLTQKDLNNLNKIYGALNDTVRLPIKYIILNPSDIVVGGNVAFDNATYYKALNTYEIERLKSKGKSQEEQELYDGLSADNKALLQSASYNIIIPLNPQQIYAIFYKKQDYEPLSVPLGFPVLDAINWKAELQKMDMAIARTAQQAVLLITAGSELKDGTVNVNQALINKLQALFTNESVGRVIVSDYTTEAKFVIPTIADILDPKKYEVANEDIRIGLNNILIGDEKFSNQSIKVKVFMERLSLGRMVFLNDFLIPEIKRISKEMGFKSYPIPEYSHINLQDEVQMARVYNRLLELGVLTPPEYTNALKYGILPTEEESVENQKTYKEQRDQGYYLPLLGGSNQAAGRPGDTKGVPQQTKEVSPMKAILKGGVSMKKLQQNMLAALELESNVKAALKTKHKLKKLNKKQLEVAQTIADTIVANEAPANWNHEIIEKYIANPIDHNPDQIIKINSLAAEYQTSYSLASLLYHSRLDTKENNGAE